MAAGRRIRIARAGGFVGSAVATVAFFIAGQAPTGTAVLWVGPDGGSCTRSGTPAEYDADTACGTFLEAHGAAQDGDTVKVAYGIYDGQTVPAEATKNVTFEEVGNTRARIGGLLVNASNLTFRHLRFEDRDVGHPVFAIVQIKGEALLPGPIDTPENITFEDFEIDGGLEKDPNVNGGNSGHPGIAGEGIDITFQDGAVGNIINEKGALFGGTDWLFDNVTFHDVETDSEFVHNECMYAVWNQGLTIRNSRFFNCATMGLILTYLDHLDPEDLQDPYSDVVIENNVFAHSRGIDGTGYHFFGFYLSRTGIVLPRVDVTVPAPLDHIRIAYNTFETPVNTVSVAGISPGAINGSEWVGNIGEWNCIEGMEYRHNVGTVCGETDTAMDPPSTHRNPLWADSRTSAALFRDPLRNDLRLEAGSPAIDAGDPEDFPATDNLGRTRSNPPTAGALEYP